MARSSTAAAVPVRYPRKALSGKRAGAARSIEFPGCYPVRLRRDEIDGHEGRYEYWEADTETAWKVREVTTLYHERPSQLLARLTERIAAFRGSPIETFGTADLLVRNERGERHRIMQADQMVYLHPERDQPGGAQVEVGEDVLPDVVLETDLTTDVRRGKLWLYESWGFPEVWVEVPDKRLPSSPRGRPKGLTIYLLNSGSYSEADVSLAFPGWIAAEIHRALNERMMSVATIEALRRVGRALGEREGTNPADDPVLGAVRLEGRREGHLAGRLEVLLELLHNLLSAKGVQISPQLDAKAEALVNAPLDAVMAAASECRDEEDFLRRADALSRK
ncbi:MAG: Uma2 family endonuclease [Gammaproteobacteria bacterium]|nr:Uma2 family endonuclease [Gammaproteobacteria bacterium]MDE0271028.1 Uma2 family endonuclease [Gammaproteobacteria bacterium]